MDSFDSSLAAGSCICLDFPIVVFVVIFAGFAARIQYICLPTWFWVWLLDTDMRTALLFENPISRVGLACLRIMERAPVRLKNQTRLFWNGHLIWLCPGLISNQPDSVDCIDSTMLHDGKRERYSETNGGNAH
ncbi:MAG: hypothetical protein P8K79_10655, partial [Mariniblastus sp.]|nr:hypothetical protein [Mariniblastus sp.]